MTRKIKDFVLGGEFLIEPDLIKMSDDFRESLKSETYDAVVYNLKKKEKNIDICNLVNLGIKVSINRRNQKLFLENLLKECTEKEDYQKCSEISSFLKQM